MTGCYQLAGPDIVHESFGGDLVVLNLASGQYFGLNPSGAVLWKAIVDGQSVAELGENDDVTNQFALQLVDLGLIVPSQANTSKAANPVSLEVPPTIEVYDDLSDLIVADPIHDVDANAGWPRMPDGTT